MLSRGSANQRGVLARELIDLAYQVLTDASRATAITLTEFQVTEAFCASNFAFLVHRVEKHS